MDRAALKLVDFSGTAQPGNTHARNLAGGFPHGLGRIGVHEVCAAQYGDGAAATGFALTAGVMAAGPGAVAWISLVNTARDQGRLSARGLASLGGPAGRMLHIDVKKPLEALWAAEEAIASSAVACVVADIPDLDFTASRRLTLASQARGTPAILLLPYTRTGATAAEARWRLGAARSAPNRYAPRSPGRARWHATLERSRSAPGAMGRAYTLEFDHETFSVHLAGELGAGQAGPLAQDPAPGPDHEIGLRKTG